MNFKQSLDILGRFTDTAVLSPEYTYFSDESMSFFGRIETPEVQEEIGLYEDVANLNKMIGLFEETKIEQDGSKLKLVDSADAENYAIFMTSDISLIRKSNFDLQEQLSRTLSVGPMIELNLDEHFLAQIKTGLGSILNGKALLSSENGELRFTIADIDMLSTESNSVSFRVQNVSSPRDFKIVILADVFNKMPKGGFKFKLLYSERANSYRAIFEQCGLVVVTPTQLV